MGENEKDIKIKELQDEVKFLKGALRADPLTGVLNRRGLEEELGDLLQEVRYTKEHPEVSRKIKIDDVALIFVDLDDFKKLNDTNGHIVGDLVLKSVAQVLLKNVRGIDSVGRFGGEEFVVILVGANEEEGYKKAEEFRERISQVRLQGHPEINITASLGVASVKNSNSEHSFELLKKADEAMYEAKKNRGKNVVVLSSEID